MSPACWSCAYPCSAHTAGTSHPPIQSSVDHRQLAQRRREHFLAEAVGCHEEVREHRLELAGAVDARDALEIEERAVKEGLVPAKRYFISSRTRSFESLPNQGLPGNMKPGKGHFENLRREREGEADLDEARLSDPVFGSREMRA